MRSGQTPPDDVAAAFGVAVDLVPLLPELLADLQALGSFPQTIVRSLRESAELSDGARVVEFGCGKGAVAISIARDLRLQTLGIDLFPPFIEEAQTRAQSGGVAHLCEFQVGDLRDAVLVLRGYDVALCAAVGAGIFHDYEGCIGELRRVARRGGYVALNDGFLSQATSLERPGYEYYRSHDETVRQLTAHGDTLVREILVPSDELAAYNRKTMALIRKRAARLAQLHPEHAELLARYLESEEAECELLEKQTTEAVWLLQRN